MKRLLLAICLLATPLYAAEAPPQIQPTDKLSVTLTAREWQAVIASVCDGYLLGKRDCDALSGAIVGQINTQIAKKK